MSELEDALSALMETSELVQSGQPAVSRTGSSTPWFRVVTPHLDIRQGRLDESIFAANLAEVALGGGREIYSNPVMFFSKTYFTSGLRNIAKSVLRGLNGQEDAENRVISLQTGFGGGKTHTLISSFTWRNGEKMLPNRPIPKNCLLLPVTRNLRKQPLPYLPIPPTIPPMAESPRMAFTFKPSGESWPISWAEKRLTTSSVKTMKA